MKIKKVSPSPCSGAQSLFEILPPHKGQSKDPTYLSGRDGIVQQGLCPKIKVYFRMPKGHGTPFEIIFRHSSRSTMNLPCKIVNPILLGEAAGVGRMKDVDSMAMPQGLIWLGNLLLKLSSACIYFKLAAVLICSRLQWHQTLLVLVVYSCSSIGCCCLDDLQ
ncbi:hypothetical protein L6452_08980 [Arctium lappa]|uniref:Uncharacterized protein n=1 Tax=Arctium lappa TaxID=4217 RepID=A0ACB9DJW3_ARCLA|nr:hypothetical protein L6452_08980 [Arctium lappa]